MRQLDPQLANVLELINQLPPTHQHSLEEARANFDLLPAMTGDPPALAGVTDRTIPGPAGEIPIRVYTPAGDRPLPLLVYFHGGGYVIGSLDSHHTVCADLAHRTGAVVVSVAYRLAPEHHFPAAVDDGYAAAAWVAEHAAELGGAGDRVGVSGDSAGGNLAAVVAILARDRGGPALAVQVLFFPYTDAAPRVREADRTPSSYENAEGYLLWHADMVWFRERYLPNLADIDDPRASPLRCADLSDLPRALVLTAGFDPLRDEGEAYAHRLREAGNDVTLRRDDDLIHGWSYFSRVIDRCDQAMEQTAVWIREAFASRTATLA